MTHPVSTHPPRLPSPSPLPALRSCLPAWMPLALALLLPGALAAQPFGSYVVFSGTGSATAGNGYLMVPDNPALDPPSAITLEGWVELATPFPAGGCRSLIGKDSSRAYWLGVCGSTLRASFGGASRHDGGTVPAGEWTHVAVTYDGITESHYIDGELVQSFPVSGPPGASSAPLEIGGDVAWPESPNGAVAEFRLWNVARTEDQIRGTINVALSSAQPGLVAVWSLAGTGGDALGTQNGSFGAPGRRPRRRRCSPAPARGLPTSACRLPSSSPCAGAPATAPRGSARWCPLPAPARGSSGSSSSRAGS